MMDSADQVAMIVILVAAAAMIVILVAAATYVLYHVAYQYARRTMSTTPQRQHKCALCGDREVIQLRPEQAGYERLHVDPRYGQVWRTPDDELFIFPPGQEHVVIACPCWWQRLYLDAMRHQTQSTPTTRGRS